MNALVQVAFLFICIRLQGYKMYRLILALALCIWSSAGFCVELPDIEKVEVVNGVRQSFEALKNKDSDAILALTSKRFIELQGGPANTKLKLDNALKLYTPVYEEVFIGEPFNPLDFNGTLFCYVPYRLIIKVDHSRYKSEGFLIAIREEQWHWTYLDTNKFKNDPETIHRYFPGYPDAAHLPQGKTQIIEQ